MHKACVWCPPPKKHKRHWRTLIIWFLGKKDSLGPTKKKSARYCSPTFIVFTSLSPSQYFQVRTISIPILQMRTLRHKEAVSPSGNGQTGDLNPWSGSASSLSLPVCAPSTWNTNGHEERFSDSVLWQTSCLTGPPVLKSVQRASAV